MSNQILTQLLDLHAFDGSPLHVDMSAFHVPFDDRGRTGTESGVLRAARSAERVGLRGPIGCGKTSVLCYTLDDPNVMIAPIWVSVAFDDDQVVLDVRRFAAHLAQSIVRDAERAGALTARDRDAILTAAAARRPLPGSERRHAARLAAKFWVAAGELAGEVKATLEGVDLQRPADQVLENVNRALETISFANRQPVVVVDDSDSFTRRLGGRSTRDQLVGGFFGPVLRALTELRAGVIVAVHDEYLQMESFARARREHGALERLLAVPPVVSGQLARILDRRSQLAASAPARDALTPAAIEALAQLNRTRTGRNLRTTLGIAHAALVAAVDRGAELIGEQDVARAAVEQLGAPRGE
jgi:enamine deaminase RidA (YjgF/YER057c/UK114 family)